MRDMFRSTQYIFIDMNVNFSCHIFIDQMVYKFQPTDVFGSYVPLSFDTQVLSLRSWQRKQFCW